MKPEPVVVSGIGAVTPVGAGAVQTCASIRAGLSGLRRHPSYFPIPPNPMVDEPELLACGIAAGDPDAAKPKARLLRMATGAMRDLVCSARLARAQVARTELIVCSATAESSGTGSLADDLAHELPRRLGIAFAKPAHAIAEGQPGTLRATDEAARRLVAGETERCLVLAVDSLIDRERLLSLDECERLRSPRTADGLLAGEAAACFLLERQDKVQARGGETLAVLGEVGFGEEPNTIAGEANSTARGLCQAIRAAIKAWGGQPVAWSICDMNGESYWAYEWGLARSRMGAALGATELWHPADCMGAVGAASAALAMVLASRALALGYAPVDRALVWCASDGKQRAACSLQAPGSLTATQQKR